MRNKPGIIFALLVSGCAAPSQPGIVVRTVLVPTPVACVPLAQIPAEPVTVASTLTGSAAHDLAIVAASALDLRAWGRELHRALVACANPDNTEN